MDVNQCPKLPQGPPDYGFYYGPQNGTNATAQIEESSSSYLAGFLVPMFFAPILAICFTIFCCGLRMNRQGQIY
jgi:hypothetical protein